ncbi:hypothetical protein QAD02_005373 [Eretmocerus hayati]|uniref:Uncharacterized protein n=1 Tax=Eretmocerus hayati TaxID=131215 RepID=A0ACC2NU19_9HYME|nr:hypothetical protein QAD02_005373 [Eretmocerus hayati]
MCSRYISGVLLKRNSPHFACETYRNAHFYTNPYGKRHSKFKWCGRRMSLWLREQGVQVFRACTRQFEFIAAQRIRRSVQIFHLYSKIWDEVALKEFIKIWKRRMARNTRDFIVASVGVTMYNWDQERISDNEVYSQEIEKIYKLRELTVVCPECHLRLVIDVTQPGIQYCQCHKIKFASKLARHEGVEWEPFIERQDMVVWRKEEEDAGGLYAYKVHGTFADVSAEDFLQVQIDTDYRKQWDATAKQLEIIDTDPLYEGSSDTHSDVIYWEMIWPRMFANRDYVYKRRWYHDKKTGSVIIVSKETEHPAAPDRTDTHRVSTYRSFMVIKPYTDYQEPGIEFVLTYFDDPGVNIPAAVTAWVALSGLPDYLCRMRQAGKDYKNYKALQRANSPEPTSVTDDESHEVNENESVRVEKNDEPEEKCSDEIGKEEVQEKSEETCVTGKSLNSELNDHDVSDNEDDIEDDDSDRRNRGFLDYIFLFKLFA